MELQEILVEHRNIINEKIFVPKIRGASGNLVLECCHCVDRNLNQANLHRIVRHFENTSVENIGVFLS